LEFVQKLSLSYVVEKRIESDENGIGNNANEAPFMGINT